MIENAEPKSQGGEILQAQVLYNQTVSNAVASLGIPDAVEEPIETTNAGVLPAKTTEFILFYRHPARTIIIESGIDFWSSEATGAVIGDLPIVPGYARVFGFNEPITGAWPVTISMLSIFRCHRSRSRLHWRSPTDPTTRRLRSKS